MLQKDTLENLIIQGLSQYQINTKRAKVVQSYKKKTCKSCKSEMIDNRGRTKTYCSVQCKRDYDYKEYITKWIAGDINAVTRGNGSISNYVRRWLKEQYGECCWECNWCEINPTTGKIPIEVDHIDGDYTNDNPDNLRLLCPNCHSLTPTYKARNKGNGRHARRERYKLGKSY